jgi:hypothetical protein
MELTTVARRQAPAGAVDSHSGVRQVLSANPADARRCASDQDNFGSITFFVV